MAAQVTHRRHHPAHAERRADLLGMARVVRPRANDFLQRDDVGIEPREHVDRALGHGAPVHAAAAMDVVGDDSERFSMQIAQSRSKSRVGLRDGLFLGLLQRLFKPLRERIAFRPFGVEGLFERRVAARLFVGKNALGVGQLDVEPGRRLAVRDDASEVQIDDQHRVAARTDDFALGLESRRIFLRHILIILPPALIAPVAPITPGSVSESASTSRVPRRRAACGRGAAL